ncbi:MAG: phosphatidylserine decarboxylase family protein [Calditrichaceae bacterium]|jgi:phosphatidylserine decarboxylase
MIAKDGYRLITFTGIIFLILLVLAIVYHYILFTILAICTGFLFVFNFFFLRDPDRHTPDGENLVISPADGTVIKIEKVNEPLYFKEETQLISIFMSVFNVHVNRIPVTGKIEFLDYKKGQYLAAFADSATDVNEQSRIGIKSNRGKILFKQIAGVLARRIVYHLKLNEKVKAGERFGLIRYGSRLDIYLPLSAKINVNLKQKVRSGETILAEYTS